MTNRAETLTTTIAIVACLVFGPLTVEAQQAGKMYRIGYLTPASEKSSKKRLDAFRQGLEALGYIEGRNIVIEDRYAAGQRKRIPTLAAELVGLNVDVIVTNGGSATRAADRASRKAGRTIPVVFALAPDPIGAKLVTSLARPGANITGLSSSNSILVPKRLDIIKEVVPSAKRIAVLWSPRNRSGSNQLKALQARASALDVTIIPVEFAKPGDFERAISDIRKASPDALNVLGWSRVNAFRKQIAAFAIKNKLPTIFTSERFTNVGGLISYGTDLLNLYRRSAGYVDKILKGVKPAYLPVALPNKFYLTVNLGTAKKLGIKVPPSILLRADKVIE
jgi:putative ABC transport system substrate-binding protein